MSNYSKITGCVQTGKSRLVIEKEDEQGTHYRIEANIVSYCGQKIREGFEIFIHMKGLSPEKPENIQNKWRLYPPSIYYFEGKEEDWPYEK